jgi:hypothetical protein
MTRRTFWMSGAAIRVADNRFKFDLTESESLLIGRNFVPELRAERQPLRDIALERRRLRDLAAAMRRNRTVRRICDPFVPTR